MDKRQEIIEACSLARQTVHGALSADGEWLHEGKSALSELISSNLVDAASTLSAATLTTILRYLAEKESLPEVALVSLLQDVNMHNSADYFRQILVDVVEDLQEQTISRAEELTSLTKAADSTIPSTSSAQRPASILRACLESGFLDALDVSHLVDPSRLSLLGLITDQRRHGSLEKRKRTNRFYRQKKYTLIRECSEGWARLVVLLGDSSAIGAGSSGLNPSGESESERKALARTLWRKIVTIIGYFDLSPARVLDLILDAFCQNLASHWRFFLDLLECTPWNVRNLANKGKAKAEDGTAQPESETSVTETEFAAAMELERGNLILTQVLGFKFSAYQEPITDLKGAIKDLAATPRELTLVAALLIKYRFVRTVDILPYLSPDDKAMEGLAEEFSARIRREMGGSGNALTLSGALKDDDAPANSADSINVAGSTNMTLEEIGNLPKQRIMLCESLLAIGHLPPAFYMLSKWPVMAQSSEVLADLILRVVKYSLEPAYQTIARSQDSTISGPNYRMHFPFSAPEPTLTTIAPEPPSTEKKKFVFFYEGWQENISRWNQVEEVVERVAPFAKFVGPHGARDIQVLVWLCRIGVAHQEQNTTAEVRKAWLDILRCLLLPSMPLLKSNYSFNIEIWPLLERLEVQQRYALYGEWQAAISNPLHARYMPVMAAAAAQTTADVKRILKRMTTAFDRVHARAIGKFSYSAPTALWAVILPQITSYQNMKTTVVESARYLSEFGWDVTIFMLLDALTNEAKTAVKQDGTSASTWLIGVAAFIGQLAKRYSSMNLHPFLQLILNQLGRDNLAGLITFKHVISAMGGIDPLNNVSPDQVKCFSGGPYLYTEGVEATRAEYPEPPRASLERVAMVGQKPQRKQNNNKSRSRLLSSLESSGLMIPLLIALCQARRSCIFTASAASEHNKQLVTSMDECHAICNQYIRFLHNTMSKEKYAQFLPTLKQLQSDYGLDIAMAYQLTRPKLHWQLYTREEYLRLRLRKYRKDLTTAENQLATWEDGDWQAPLWPIMVDTAHFATEEVRASHLVPFHATFWQLGLGEIACPDDMYGQVIKRLKDVARDLEEWAKPGVALDADWSAAYRANRTAILSKIQALTAEKDEQIRIAADANVRIEKEAGKWFPECTTVQLKHKLAHILHRECFYPRAIFSMSDATFVAKIGPHLHKKRVSNFSLLIFYDKFFSDALASCIFSCSEAQATNLGRCLGLMLKDIEIWRASKAIYDEEALGNKNADTGLHEYEGMRLYNNEYLTWEKWGNMVYKWHRKLLKAISTGLQADDYLHIKNTIHVARNLLPAYPKAKSVFAELTKVTREFIEAETKSPELTREDLHLAVKSYEDALTVADRNAGFIIPDDQFFTRLLRPGAQPRVATSKAATSEDGKALSPTTSLQAKPEAPQTEASGRTVDIDMKKGEVLRSEVRKAETLASDELSIQQKSEPVPATVEAEPTRSSDSDRSLVPLRDTTPPKKEAGPSAAEPNIHSQKGIMGSRLNSPPHNGPAPPSLNGSAQRDRAVPREPRSSMDTNDQKPPPAFRSMDPPAAPRGPIHGFRQEDSPRNYERGSRYAPAHDLSDPRDRTREVPAPTAPRYPRDRDARISHVSESYRDGPPPRAMAVPARRSSPGRQPTSRSGSVDSRYSRASDHHRDAERRSERRDRDREKDRDREREKEKERPTDTQRDKDVERPRDPAQEHSQRSERHRMSESDRERRRDARERDEKRDDKRDERRDDKRDDKGRREDRRDRERERDRRDRDRDRDRRDKDRSSRTSRRGDDPDKEKENEKSRDKERSDRPRDHRERDKGEHRDRDDRDRPREADKRDRDGLTDGDGHRERPQSRGGREREGRDDRGRPGTLNSSDSTRIGSHDTTSVAETRTSIDALSARFEAKRQSSFSDSRGPTHPSPSAEAARSTPPPRELITETPDNRRIHGDNKAVERNGSTLRISTTPQISQSQAPKPPVLSLSERLGPIVAPNNDSPKRRPSPESASQPAPPKPIGVGSGLAAALAAAAGNMSPEIRKRPNEDSSAEGNRGSIAPATNSKRTRVERPGGRDRPAGAFGRLSGGVGNGEMTINRGGFSQHSGRRD